MSRQDFRGMDVRTRSGVSVLWNFYSIKILQTDWFWPVRLRDIKFSLKTSTRTRSALKMVERGVTWSWLTSIYSSKKKGKCLKVIQMHSFFACLRNNLGNTQQETDFHYWVRPRIGDGRTWFFVVLSHFNICLEKNTTRQKFYRKLKVNHVNITSLLFAVTGLIKGNNCVRR